MERRKAVKSRLHIFVAVLALAATFGFAAPSVAEPPAGSKNFSTPAVAPNYFSNEGGPVARQPAPLPAAPPAASSAVREEAEEPAPQAAAAPPRAERPVVTTARARDRHRPAHAQARRSDSRKAVAVRSRNVKPARVVAHSDRPRAARLAHAEPHAAKTRPVSAKGPRAGRG
jgi:hypothetical protein